jgi:glucans biosynthesis protein C
MNRKTDGAANHLLFFDLVRTVAMLAVVIYHAVAAYSIFTPHWTVHDGHSIIADMIRHLFDVFMMPTFFFIAGYFAILSLTKHGAWKFLHEKFRRIGVPWLLAIFIVIPLVRYAGDLKASGRLAQPFGQYWITYLMSFGRLQSGLLTSERMNQMHFWFLSLLLIFFFGLTLWYAANKRKWQTSGGTPAQGPASRIFIWKVLLAATVLTTLGYFIISCLTSEMSWVTIDLFLQFQPASLILYIACFVLGAIAFSGQWFAGDEFPQRLFIWVPAGLLLTAGFFVIGRDIFAHPTTSNQLSSVLLLAFSLIRTLLCLVILIILLACARRYWNRPSRLNQALAVNSYNIYLAHIFLVVTLQHILMVWPGGPPMVKAAIVFLVVLPLSYGISRLIDRFPRAFAIGLIAIFILVLIAKR